MAEWNLGPSRKPWHPSARLAGHLSRHDLPRGETNTPRAGGDIRCRGRGNGQHQTSWRGAAWNPSGGLTIAPNSCVRAVALQLDASPDDLSLVGQTIEGKFAIRSLIGVGGTSLVFEGWHEVLQHPIAVKVLRAEFACIPELAAHFALEGRVTAQLNGPHVVRVLDTGTLDGVVPYTVMERLRGVSVADLLLEHGALPPALALELAIQAADALVEAHAHGIVHRDVKPDNLYVVDLPNGGQILKVIDFGIAQGRAIPTGLKRAGVGSAGYMAPEQIVSPDAVDGRADVWGLGVVLFEMLTGRLPFRGTTADELMISAQCDEPLPIDVAAQGLPHDLYVLIEHCLRKERGERPASMREVLSELERLRPLVQASTTAVALPLRLRELGQTLLPQASRGRDSVHRSGLMSRRNPSTATVPLRREEENEPLPLVARSSRGVPVESHTELASWSSSESDFKRLNSGRRTKAWLAGISLVVAACGALIMTNGTSGWGEGKLQPASLATAPPLEAHVPGLEPIVLTEVRSDTALDLALSERDTALAPDGEMAIRAAPSPRSLLLPQRAATVSAPPASRLQKPEPAAEPAAPLELLTPWSASAGTGSK